MAASITANPNPVLISVWGLPQKIARITWNTGSTAFGRVYLSVDGGNETFFDGTPEGPDPVPATKGKRYNSSPPPIAKIELGKTYDFRLKQATMLGPVLVTLRIKGDEKLGLTSGLAKIVQELLPKSQSIFGLKVIPDIESVRIRFRTRQAVNSFIEIKNDKTNSVVAVALLDNRLAYDVFIGSGIGITPQPLEQDTNHTFKIVAPALPGSLIPDDKTVTGQFRTGTRTAQVFFDKIVVRDDGDPGFVLGAGDFAFNFVAGDVDSTEVLDQFEYFADISSGESRNVNRIVTIPNAPPRLWVQVVANETDATFGGVSAGHFAPPGSTFHDNDDDAVAEITQHLDFSELMDDIEERPFELSSGPHSFDISVFGRLRVEARPGVLIQPAMTKSATRPRSPLPRAAILKGAGERVIVGMGSVTAHAFLLASDGELYAKTLSRQRAAGADRWTRIGGNVAGPLTLVAAAGDRVSLFALARDGAVMHKSLSREAPSNGEWENFGGAFTGTIAAAAGPDGRIEMFGLTSDGHVLHCTLGAEQGRRAASEWQLIGEGVGGSLTAFSSAHGDVSVVAVGRGGEVLHKLRRGDEWRPAGHEWQSLGTAPAGPLSAELVEDDIVVLAVLAEKETIQLRPWRNYPDTPPREGWQCAGTINSLLNARLSLIGP